MIKSRLIAYGMIRKGRPERCLMVVLDERFGEAREDEDGLLAAWRRGYRRASAPAKR